MAGEPILVVEDNEINSRLVSFLLSSRGYVVREAPDAREALRLLGELHPRMIVMDLQLPGMDGYELTRRLKADPATRDIVVLALTASAMSGDEEKALRAGCDAYFTKPIDRSALLAGVARFLAASRSGAREDEP